MALNVFDQAARYAIKLDPYGLLAWLLLGLGGRLVFNRWLDTQTIPYPGDPDRRCDTVAELIPPDQGEPPWALILESQTEPDSDLPDRALEYLARLRRELRYGPHGRDRYSIGVAVLNLTGVAQTDRIEMVLPGGDGVEFCWRFLVVTMADKDAAETLRMIRDGQASLCLLPWIPLMRGGDQPATIVEWKELANREPVTRRKADYGGLAVIFAQLTGCSHLWREALEDWAMMESTIVNEWMAKGRLATLSEVLLKLLAKHCPQGLPPEVVSAVQNQEDEIILKRWVDAAIAAGSFEEATRALFS